MLNPFKTVKLSDALLPDNNNFDLIRLIAAIAVLFGHSYWLQPAAGRMEPILQATHLEYSGSLSVYSFFLISGMMISASFARSASNLKFVTSRILRVYPALIFCITLTTYLMYPALSDVSFLEALASVHSTEYLLTNIGLFFNTLGVLPGLFDSAPLGSVINGSLWTLPLELKCYLVLFIAGSIGYFRSKLRAYLIIAVLVISFFYLIKHGTTFSFIQSMAAQPTGYSFYAPAFFLIGMTLYLFRDKIFINPVICAAALCGYVALRHTAAGPVLFYCAFIYALLNIAATPILHKIRIRNDYSYGVYLWAFPVQQAFASRFPDADNLLSLVVTIPATIALAALSWHLVEKRSIALGRAIFLKKNADIEVNAA